MQRTGQEGQSQSQDQLSTGGGAGREAQAPRTILLVHLCLLNINRLELFLIGREVDVNKGVILHMGFVNFAEDFAKKLSLDSWPVVSESRQNLIVCNRGLRVVQVLICCFRLTAVPQACV